MAAPNRATLIAKTHKVLKQQYEAVKPDSDRPLLQQMLFACCLENAPYSAAEKVYARLSQNFFDWNEVRVSTVTELAEVMKELPEPSTAANNLKRILQGVFESTYSFDLDQLKKQNIGQGIKRLAGIEGVTPFVLGYTVQTALAGHSIPLDRGALEVLGILGIATQAEVQSGNVTGLERAIAKNKAVEFGSLLHQLAADYFASPHSAGVKKTLTAINPHAVVPKRSARREINNKAADARPADVKPADGKIRPKGGDHQPDDKTKIELSAKKPKAVEKPGARPADKVPPKGDKAGQKAAAKKPAPAALAKTKSPTKQLAKRKPR